MTLSPGATSGEQTLYATLELSKNSWLLAIQFPDRDNPSLHRWSDNEPSRASSMGGESASAPASANSRVTAMAWGSPLLR